jgi:hypothetical protein
MRDWGSSTTPSDPPLNYDWVTDRVAVGGAIWTHGNMARLAEQGFTHVIDMQVEFDDRQIADGTGVSVLWNPCDDDFEDKPPELFQRGVEFATETLQDPRNRLYIHCAAGVHRAPMMMLAILTAQGMEMGEALNLIRERRPEADFPDVYRRSVALFLQEYYGWDGDQAPAAPSPAAPSPGTPPARRTGK